jgi:hypothetical protein
MVSNEIAREWRRASPQNWRAAGKPQARRLRVVAEWRGYPEGPTETSGCFCAIGEILKAFLGKLNLSERLGENTILEAWKEMVGGFFASHSTPVRLKSGVLYVQVHQSSVRYELDRVWKPRILTRLQQRFGKMTVRELRF